MAGQKRETRLRAGCPGHPRLCRCWIPQDVDARHEAGHDVELSRYSFWRSP